MPEHVYLLLSIPLRVCLLSFMGYLKGELMMVDRYANQNTVLEIKTFGQKVIMYLRLDSVSLR